MELLKDRSTNCLIVSAAMVFGIYPEDIIQALGHDGTECFKATGQKVGVHIQEIQHFAFTIGHALALIEPDPIIGYSEEVSKSIWSKFPALVHLSDKIQNRRAIVIYDTHAVAWDGKQVFDPKGFRDQLHLHDIREVWIDLIL